MKKMKKIFAVLLTLAMVLGMNATVFAAPDDEPEAKTATITVTNLQDSTAVDFYQMIVWDENGEWTVNDWAKNLLTQDETTGAWIVNESAFAALEEIPSGAVKDGKTEIAAAGKVVHTVAPGAYLIKANDSTNKVIYGFMVANTFDEENQNVAADVTVVAKGETFGITKTIVNGTDTTATKNFVGIGDSVEFQVVTYFPNFDPTQNTNLSYKIVDTPTGMTLAATAQVKIGDGAAASVNVTKEGDGYTIDLSNKIATKADGTPTNEDAGKTVTITYTGTVTGETGYTNKVDAYKNGSTTPITPTPDPDEPDPEPPVKGFTGDISIKKIAEGSSGEWADLQGLAGAEFTVARAGKDGTADEALKFVKTAEGVYKLALKDAETGTYESGSVDNVVVNENGIVKVMGLGEGTYKFVEVVAPAGYSVDSQPVSVTITPAQTQETLEDISLKDTKADSTLASLPSTGGIGTTIFTIGGCAIMIIAAGLYFATRRKTVK